MQYTEANLDKVFRILSRAYKDKKFTCDELMLALRDGYEASGCPKRPCAKSTLYGRLKNPVKLYPLFKRLDFEIFCHFLEFKGLNSLPSKSVDKTKEAALARKHDIYTIVVCKDDDFVLKRLLAEYLDKAG